MRKRERGEPRREHTAAAGGEEERRGEGERESQRITRKEREREKREGLDTTPRHDEVEERAQADRTHSVPWS